MKIINLLSVFLFVVLVEGTTANAQSNLLSAIDTNIVLTYNGTPLRYYQYVKMLRSNEYTIMSYYDADNKFVKKEIVKTWGGMKKAMKMDKESVDKRIASYFGIEKQEKLSLAGVDTTIKVFDETGKALSYYQYMPLVLSAKFWIIPEKDKRYLKPVPKNMEAFIKTDGISLNNSIYYALHRADHIRVEKSKRKLYLERNGKIIFECPINLGKHPIGAKQKEGDGRTPEGSYYMDYNINSKAAYYWGFHISYPNAQDSINAKKMHVNPGKDVMIHGTSPQRSKLKDWTNGCIAISNAHIDTLVKYIYNSIPIQINK